VFDGGYARKYDEDLNASLSFVSGLTFIFNAEGTQAGPFSAISSAFVIDIQLKFQPDPNEIAAAYMQILIQAVNSSLFPDTDLDPVTWAGPLFRDCHRPVSALCESCDLTFCRVSCDAGEIAGQPVSLELWWFRRR